MIKNWIEWYERNEKYLKNKSIIELRIDSTKEEDLLFYIFLQNISTKSDS